MRRKEEERGGVVSERVKCSCVSLEFDFGVSVGFSSQLLIIIFFTHLLPQNVYECKGSNHHNSKERIT